MTKSGFCSLINQPRYRCFLSELMPLPFGEYKEYNIIYKEMRA
jgi:hypothetical protein